MQPVRARPRLSLSRLDHPITRGLPPGLRVGPHRPIGPLFFCDDPQADVLGHQTGMRDLTHYEIDGGPGLAVRDFGTWRSVWCGVPGLPAPLLRGIARWAGVHVYSDQDDVVYATRSLLAVHARHAGRRIVRLPARCDVTDADRDRRGIDYPILDDSTAQLARRFGLQSPVAVIATDAEGRVLVNGSPAVTGQIVEPDADVTVVEITSTLRTGLRTQVPAGRAEGLDRDSAANCDILLTVPERMLGHRRGALDPADLFRPDAALKGGAGPRRTLRPRGIPPSSAPGAPG